MINSLPTLPVFFMVLVMAYGQVLFVVWVACCHHNQLFGIVLFKSIVKCMHYIIVELLLFNCYLLLLLVIVKYLSCYLLILKNVIRANGDTHKLNNGLINLDTF